MQMRSGLKIITIAAVATLLGACASTDSTDDTEAAAPAPAPAPEPADSTGPGAVDTAEVESESLMDQYGAPTQAGLDSYAGDRVFFEFDKSTLTASARRTLQQQAEWLEAHSDVDVLIEGHCDERGTREYNLALGERRANAVRDYLVALGINDDRIDTISYGKERPAVLGSGEDVWSQNRRGVTKVQSDVAS